MPISFDAIPAQWRMPLFWAEVDPSMAGLPIVRDPILLVGSMIADPTDTTIYPTPDPALPTGVVPGIAVPNIPKPIGTQAQADREYGMGSELASMFAACVANNFAHETWCLPVAPLAGSEASSGTITVVAPATEAGMIHLYIAGHHVGIAIGTTDLIADIATQLAAAINANPKLPVVATSAAAVVTLTAKTRGDNGDDITVQLNFYGKIGGQELPPGCQLTLPATGRLTGGGGVPDFTVAISNLGEHAYEYVALPHTDSNTLFDWEQEFGFEDIGRWGWMRQLYGMIFCAKRGEYSDLLLWGDPITGATPNFGPISVMGVEETAASPVYEWCAAYCAKAARALTNDPARPLQTLKLNKILPCQREDSFILPELNSLSGVGIATQKIGSDGQPMVMRDTTTYQLNLYGQSDDAYELVTTMSTLARIIRNQRQVITSKFPRHKLANDGTRFGVGQKIVTPKIVKAELVSQYRIDEFNGLVEDVASFKDHLIVERDPNNPNRLNVLWPPDLVNQLRVYAVLVQFRLQYNRGQDLEVIR
jgi:phage tail sheath gpL-like